MTLSANNLSFAYTQRTRVLEDVSAAFRPDRLSVIAGPNGAGKTTLLRLLLGLRTPEIGGCTLRGTDIPAMSAQTRAKRLAYVPQRPDAAFDFSVRKVVAFGGYASGSQPARVDDVLQTMEVADLADRVFGHLSTGQQQRISVARALHQLGLAGDRPQNKGGRSRFILADEPVAALDPRHQLRVLELFRSLASSGQGVGIVVVLHDLALAARFADDVVLLGADGRVARAGTADEVFVPGVLDGLYRTEFAFLESADSPRPIPIASRVMQ